MRKAERVDRVRNSLDSTEVERRYPEIGYIEDGDLRNSTYRFFEDACPEYFWERPASSSGKYHPSDESGAHGTWLHSKRVFIEYESLSEGPLEMGEISELKRECGLAAALIHDCYNYGWPSDNRSNTTSEHDVIVADAAEHIAELPGEVISLVETHMGPWGEGPEPISPNEMCFHYADKSASTSNHTASVYEPAEELAAIPSVSEY